MRLSLCSLAVTGVVSIAAAGSAPRPVAQIPTGTAPCGAAAGFGSVWIANDAAGTLARINPRTNRVARRVRVKRGACSVAVGAGAVWVVNYRQSALLRVDPRTGRVRKLNVDSVPFDVLVAFGRIWVTGWEAGRLDEIDPRTFRVVRRLDVGPRPAGLAAAAGGVWIGFGRDATAIARVDPVSGAVERFPVGERAPGWFAAGTRDFWIQAGGGDVVHFDPVQRRVLARLQVGRTLAQGAAAPDGTIWMPDKEQSVVYRIDPAKERVIDSFPAGAGAYVALRAYGAMWVTSYASNDVWRFRPGR
jgi:streptogramin lyase